MALAAEAFDVSDLLGAEFSVEQAARAERLLDMAAGIIAAQVPGLAFVALDSTDLLDGVESTTLTLPHRPVTSVAEVTIDGEVFVDYAITARGELIRSDGGLWGCRDTVISVHAVYGPTGRDVGFVAADMVRNAWVNPGGLTSETVGQRSAAFDAEARGMVVTSAHRRILSRYRPSAAAVPIGA